MNARHVAAVVAILLLVLLVGVVLPERTKERLDALRDRLARDPGARVRFYLRYLVVTAAGLAVCAGVVALGGEGWVSAGAGFPAQPVISALLVAVLALVAANAVLYVARAYAERYDPDALDRRRQLGRIVFLLPHTRAERRLWPLVALAIAVMEESLFRGIFVLYFAAVTGLSPWPLAVVMSVVFAAGHRYQAWLGVVASGGLGLAFGIVTAGTRTIWPATVLHALVDLRIAYLPRGDISEFAGQRPT